MAINYASTFDKYLRTIALATTAGLCKHFIILHKIEYQATL